MFFGFMADSDHCQYPVPGTLICPPCNKRADIFRRRTYRFFGRYVYSLGPPVYALILAPV